MGGIGSGGYNKKSTEQHKLDGTYRKDRHEQKQEQTNETANDIKPPEWFSEEQRKCLMN